MTPYSGVAKLLSYSPGRLQPPEPSTVKPKTGNPQSNKSQDKYLKPYPADIIHLISRKPEATLTYQNLLFCRVPMNSILGFFHKNLQKSRVWEVKVEQGT